MSRIVRAGVSGAIALGALLVAVGIWPACDDDERPPLGGVISDGGTSPGPGGGSTDVDADTDTDEDGGPDGGDTDTEPLPTCLEDEVEQEGEGLCWRRCPVGQEWISGGDYCNGLASDGDWNWAVAACVTMPGDYHLATRNEIIGLLGDCEERVLDGDDGYCDTCTISEACSDMFYFDSADYWIGTDGVPYPWMTSFLTGRIEQANPAYFVFGARCVRYL